MSSDGSEEELDDEDFDPETGAVLTTPATLEVTLEQWKQASGSYNPSKLSELVDVITKHHLHGRHVRELLYDVLSMCTGLPHSTLSAQLDLPSYSTQQRAMLTAAEDRKQKVVDIVQQHQLIGLECDEGTFARLKHFVVLAVLPYHQRQLLGVPTITDTTAKTQLNTLLGALSGTGKGVEQWLYMVSDSAAPLVKAHQDVQKLKDDAFKQPADCFRWLTLPQRRLQRLTRRRTRLPSVLRLRRALPLGLGSMLLPTPPRTPPLIHPSIVWRSWRSKWPHSQRPWRYSLAPTRSCRPPSGATLLPASSMVSFSLS
mmetsp:Transcript_22169/g.57821  ORF Transcript_22169/g.57821 Transcript_22169/m.57821 type:complete len:314 (+) Transcript_22169:602-1543(+)